MEFYNSAVNMFIRPPRAQYTAIEMGPTRMTIGGRQFVREDLTLTNQRSMKLQCSHFLPVPEQRGPKLPCLVYLHGNCGCRVDALEILHLVLGLNISLFALDFSGSGQSDGEYISLGYYEKEDVAVVFEHLRQHPLVANIGLWGVSMGAATSLWFSSIHADWVTCIIADSPFAKLTRVAQDIVHQQEMKAPKWLVSGTVSVGLKMVRKSIKKKAKFDIRNNSPIAYVHSCKAPALFAHADTDRVIPSKHSAELFEKYPNLHKRFLQFPGDHNTPRPVKFFDAASRFLWEYLLEPVHKQTIAAPLKTLGNTPVTLRPNVWLVRRLPQNPEDAANILLSEALCLLVIDQHGVKAVTPFTEQPIVSQKWYTIVVYWSVSTHFCVDFKYSDGRHGRWIFSTLEAEEIMNAAKRQVQDLKPRSKKKLLLKGPTAEGLDHVAKGIKAFSPKSQLQLEVQQAPESPVGSPQLSASVDSPAPLLEHESKIMVPGIREGNQRRVEKVGILPKPGEEEQDQNAVMHSSVAALPWEAYATPHTALPAKPPAQSRPLPTAQSSPSLTRSNNGPQSEAIRKETSLERHNTTVAVHEKVKVKSKGSKEESGGLHKSREGRRSREGPKEEGVGLRKSREGAKHSVAKRHSNDTKGHTVDAKEKERVGTHHAAEKEARKARPVGAKEAADPSTPTTDRRKHKEKTKEGSDKVVAPVVSTADASK